MKIIKILSILLLIVGLSSCQFDGYDDAKCADLVRKTYPDKRVYVDKAHYKYLIVDSTGNVIRAVISGSTLRIDKIEGFVEIK